jgi:hypothetical protein
VKLVTYADPASQIFTSVTGVSSAGVGLVRVGAIEARVAIRSDGMWRAAATGEARVEIQRSSLLGALWWAMRQRVRSDILL